MACWTNHAALPRSVDEQECLKVLDELHRLDQVPWDGPTGIYAICKYGAKVWFAEGYIGSPVALRKWTQAQDMRKWEKIQQQMSQSPHSTANGQSSHQAYHIANAQGEPLKDQQERLQAILANGWESDPDPGHPWSISDEDIALARGSTKQSLPDQKKEGTP